MSDMTLGAVLRRMQGDATFVAMLRREERIVTADGFRSIFRDWAPETGKPSDVAEAALAQTLGSKVQAAYQRDDLLARQRTLMTAWAIYLTGTVGMGDVEPRP